MEENILGQGTCAFCEKRLTDHDGSIVYDVYEKEALINYHKKFLKQDNPELDSIVFGSEEIDYYILWLCEDCKTANVWSQNSDKYRAFKLTEDLSKKIDLNEIKKLQEIFIIHSLDDTSNIYLSDFLNKNPLRPFKYYVSKDFCYIYIINIDENFLDRVYKLFMELN